MVWIFALQILDILLLLLQSLEIASPLAVVFPPEGNRGFF